MNLKNCIFILVLLQGMTQGVFAQKVFQVVDMDSGKPLVGATAVIATSSNFKAQLLISDANGNFVPDRPFPIKAEIKFLGYSSQEVEVSFSGQQIKLERSSKRLDDVVITGQYLPQSAKNSVYKVLSIDADRIKSQGAVSLLDVLSNDLNFRISRDNATGRSGIQFQGLNGQYVMILLDGVPISGKGGVGNDIDPGQIDVQIIDRIEVVEGPMAVNYGADALAGVVNIITKKDITSKLDLDILLQEESIGSEYSLFDRGIHSPSIKLGYKIKKRWYTQVNARYQRYGGWIGGSVGRVKDWYPKKQQFGGFLTRYEFGNLSIYYRLDFLNEKLENYGKANQNNSLTDPFAIDQEYLSKRFMHQVQGDLKLGSANLNAVISLTNYDRNTRQFSKNLITQSETPTVDSEQDTIFYRSFFTRETINNFVAGEWGSFQIGVDGAFETVGGTTLNDGDKELADIGFFISAEVVLGSLKVRPGVRFTHNSIFETNPTASINFSLKTGPQMQVRWSYGRGFRAPSLRELYHEFIDANHNLIGNPELQPEYSHSVNLDVTQSLKDVPFEFSFGGFFTKIDNLITFFAPEGTSNQVTSYTNLLKFKTTGLNLRALYELNRLSVQLGGTYNGRFQRLSEDSGLPEFLFTPEINSIVNYRFEKTDISLSAFYKFNGANKNYQLDEDGIPQLRKTDGFHLLDVTLSKPVKNFNIGVGARNIGNVTSVNNSLSGGAHSGGTQSSVANGRSYFLRLNYHFQQ